MPSLPVLLKFFCGAIFVVSSGLQIVAETPHDYTSLTGLILAVPRCTQMQSCRNSPGSSTLHQLSAPCTGCTWTERKMSGLTKYWGWVWGWGWLRLQQLGRQQMMMASIPAGQQQPRRSMARRCLCLCLCLQRRVTRTACRFNT